MDLRELVFALGVLSSVKGVPYLYGQRPYGPRLSDMLNEVLEEQACPRAKLFASSEYVLMGYHSLYGYPLASYRDPGFTLPIFEAELSDKKFTPDCKHQAPKGIIHSNDISCDVSFSTSEVKSQKDLSESLVCDVDVSGGGWGKSFSASTDYKLAKQSMAEWGQVIIISTARCHPYTLSLDVAMSPPFHPSFINSVHNLLAGDGSEKAKYMAFFDTYGTHFLTKASFGAKHSLVFEMSQSAYNKARQSSLSVATQAKYAAMLSINAGVVMDSETRQVVSDFQRNTRLTSSILGGKPVLHGDGLTCTSTSHDSLMPVKYRLESIENLFTPAFFSDSDIDYELVRGNIIKYKAKYCERLKANGQVDTCEDNVSKLEQIRECDVKFGRSCYKLINQKMSQPEAQEHCRKHFSGHLVAIETSEEKNALKPILKDNVGTWTDGKTLSDGNGQRLRIRWETSGQIADSSVREPTGDGECVEVYANGYLKDRSCGKPRTSICEYDVTESTHSDIKHKIKYGRPVRTNSLEDSFEDSVEQIGECDVKFGRSCYKLINQKMSQPEAQEHCRKYFAGHLVTIETAEKKNALKPILDYSGTWTDGKMLSGGNGQPLRIRWETSGQITDLNMRESTRDGDCVVVYLDGDLNGHSCGERRPAICEYDA